MCPRNIHLPLEEPSGFAHGQYIARHWVQPVRLVWKGETDDGLACRFGPFASPRKHRLNHCIWTTGNRRPLRDVLSRSNRRHLGQARARCIGTLQDLITVICPTAFRQHYEHGSMTVDKLTSRLLFLVSVDPYVLDGDLCDGAGRRIAHRGERTGGRSDPRWPRLAGISP